MKNKIITVAVFLSGAVLVTQSFALDEKSDERDEIHYRQLVNESDKHLLFFDWEMRRALSKLGESDSDGEENAPTVVLPTTPESEGEDYFPSFDQEENPRESPKNIK